MLMLRTPFLRVALTRSWLTGTGKVKLRAKEPEERSEIQYCAFGVSGFLAGSGCAGVVVDSSCAGVFSASATAEALTGSSSETVAW